MNRHVLFVDDDVKLLDGVTRRFETLFELQVASSGEEGLQKIRESGPFAVVVSDMRMPVMDGLQFIEQARGIAQETVFMMLTGNQDLLTASNAVNRGQVFRFLTKPCPAPRSVAPSKMEFVSTSWSPASTSFSTAPSVVL